MSDWAESAGDEIGEGQERLDVKRDSTPAEVDVLPPQTVTPLPRLAAGFAQRRSGCDVPMRRRAVDARLAEGAGGSTSLRSKQIVIGTQPARRK